MLNPRAETVLSAEDAASYCDRILAQRQKLGLSATDAAGMVEHLAEYEEAAKVSSDAGKQSIATMLAAQPDKT